MIKKSVPFIILGVICLILFYKPLLSGQPLGLDTMGHLSRISYLQEFPFVNWDMNWYSGTLFLKLYPPLFYYLALIFKNSIWAANILSFMSIFLTSIGIYLFINYKTHKRKIAFLSGLSYLTTLSISYYWIATGNLPYFFALWMIPFSLYFLEKSIITRRKKFFVFYCIIFSLAILTHVVVGFLIGALMIFRILFKGVNKKNLKKLILYGGIPVLLASLWFIPFLFYSTMSGGYEGYAPTVLQLFGFKDNVAWGLQAGGIGVLIFLFLSSLFLIRKKYKDKEILFYLCSIIFLSFLLLGGLRSHYPLGVDPVRFILPLSVLLSCFFGIALSKTKILENKKFLTLILLVLLIGIIWNFKTISQNFERFSYYKEDSRYGIFQDIMNEENFPLKNEFTNYRFGTSKFIFGENLNYFMPNVPQTFGYQDAGMLDAPKYYDMRWNIWKSENISDSIYWLDWFGIKYFESENNDAIDKFKNDNRFRKIMNYSGRYDFTLFEYLEAKQIISLVDYINETSFGMEKEFNWKRNNPDEIKITYENIDDDYVLFKEFYHKSWRAKDINGDNYKIEKVGPGFMAVHPSIDSKGIIFYQSKTPEEIFGIILTILGIILLIIVSLKKD